MFWYRALADVFLLLLHFRIGPALAFKYGYADVETMHHDAQKRFSLVENKIVDMPHTRLVMIGVCQDHLRPFHPSFVSYYFHFDAETKYDV